MHFPKSNYKMDVAHTQSIRPIDQEEELCYNYFIDYFSTVKCTKNTDKKGGPNGQQRNPL